MNLSALIAIYIFLTFYAFSELSPAAGFAVFVLGAVLAALSPVFRKIRKQNVRKAIEEGVKTPFINVNTAPCYILEELPSIGRIVAKRIVYVRKRHGKYKSLDDFFKKLGIEDAERLKDFLKV